MKKQTFWGGEAIVVRIYKTMCKCDFMRVFAYEA